MWPGREGQTLILQGAESRAQSALFLVRLRHCTLQLVSYPGPHLWRDGAQTPRTSAPRPAGCPPERGGRDRQPGAAGWLKSSPSSASVRHTAACPRPGPCVLQGPASTLLSSPTPPSYAVRDTTLGARSRMAEPWGTAAQELRGGGVERRHAHSGQPLTGLSCALQATCLVIPVTQCLGL